MMQATENSENHHIKQQSKTNRKDSSKGAKRKKRTDANTGTKNQRQYNTTIVTPNWEKRCGQHQYKEIGGRGDVPPSPYPYGLISRKGGFVSMSAMTY